MNRYTKVQEELAVYRPEKSRFFSHLIGPLLYAAIPNLMIFSCSISALLSGDFATAFSIFVTLFLIIFPFNLPIALYIFWRWRSFNKLALRIYDGGIGLHDGTDYYFIEWDNLENIELQKEPKSSVWVQGIKLRNALAPQDRSGNAKPKRTLDFIPIDENLIYIPVASEMDLWKTTRKIDIEVLAMTELGHYLAKFTPHIFSELLQKRELDLIPLKSYKRFPTKTLTILTALILLALIPFMVWSIIAEEASAAIIIVNFSLALFILIIYRLLASHQLELNVYKRGLELASGKASLFTSWENIESFTERAMPIFSQYGFCLKQDARPMGGFLGRLFLKAFTNFIPVSYIIDLPKSSKPVDLGLIAETEFGQLIFPHLKHLFPIDELKQSFIYPNESWYIQEQKREQQRLKETENE